MKAIKKTHIRRLLSMFFILCMAAGLLMMMPVKAEAAAPPYTITFNPKGGSLSGPATRKTDAYGRLTSLPPDPVRPGYHFLRWYYVDGNYSSNEKEVNIATKFYEDTTVYASWRKAYTVTFDLNGGSGSDISLMTNKDYKLSELPPAPTRSGYNFEGWYTARTSGGDKIYANNTVFMCDTVVYARWTKRNDPPYTIWFNPNGGSGPVIERKTDSNGRIYNIPEGPTREGYGFAGWYRYSGSNSVNIYNGDLIYEDTVAYARWKKLPTITFKTLQDDVPNPAPMMTDSTGRLSKLPEDPSWSRGEFLGWYIDSGNAGIKVTTDTVFELGRDYTVYAHWKVTAHRIVFDYWVGSILKSSVIKYTDSNGRLSELPEDPTPIFRAFLGWYTEQDGGTKITADTVFTKDTFIYAHSKALWMIYFCLGYSRPEGGDIYTYMYADVNNRLSKLPEEPTRPGYVFLGWYTDSTGGTQISTSTVFDESEMFYVKPRGEGCEVTVFAQWGTASSIPDGLHQEADGRWILYWGGKQASDYTGLTLYNDTWYYVENGVLNWNYTGLTLYGDTWYYVENGALNWGYTGLTQFYGTWYYVENGALNWGYTGLTLLGETWYYVENGVLNWGYTGLAPYGGGWFYVENGVLNWGYTGLILFYDTWYYVVNGSLNWDYTGLVEYQGGWYYVENSVLNWGYTGLVEYQGGWYYVENGSLNWGYTGMVLYYGTWYYIENGWLNWNLQ